MDNLIYTWLLEMLPADENNFEQNLKRIHDIILEYWGKDSPSTGCIFITPEGKFLNLYPLLLDHNRLCDWINKINYEPLIKDATWFTDKLSYVRCRNDSSMHYIVLPEKITTKQLYAIQDWLELKATTDTLDINVPGGVYKTYQIAKYFPEDFIKIIKRFYSSGKLYESIV